MWGKPRICIHKDAIIGAGKFSQNFDHLRNFDAFLKNNDFLRNLRNLFKITRLLRDFVAFCRKSKK